MLYISTRNTADFYTAYRALHEEHAPDGGFYAPYRLRAFTKEEIATIKRQSFGETVSQVLNRFFGLHLSGWDVECAIGRSALKLESMNHRLIIAEAWHNPDSSWNYLLNSLYCLMVNGNGSTQFPSGWAYIAIEIALLCGLYSVLDHTQADGFDLAVTTGDFSDVVAVLYAKYLGIPINVVVCTCNENSSIWDFINKGEFSTNAPIVKTNLPLLDVAIPKYLELFAFKCLGADAAQKYLNACNRKATYYVDDHQLKILNDGLYSAVVSTNRVDHIITSMVRANQYHLDAYTALAYGGLQDYRAQTGISKTTVLLAKRHPAHKEGG